MIKTFKRAYNLLRAKTRDVGISTKRSPQWRHIQQDFLSRNPVCAICGSKEKLNVHHKKPFHLHPELELDESNLITLCMSKKECHLLIGHGDNFSCFCPNLDTYVKEYERGEKTFEELCITAKKERVS